MPSLANSGGYMFLLWCLLAMTVCAFVVARPVKFFRLLSLGRPLPKLIEKRWVVLAYRIVASAIFVHVFRLVLGLFRP